MAQALMPGWMQGVATLQPGELGGAGGPGGPRRRAPTGASCSTRMGWLALFTVICTWLATRAFRVYQRSI